MEMVNEIAIFADNIKNALQVGLTGIFLLVIIFVFVFVFKLGLSSDSPKEQIPDEEKLILQSKMDLDKIIEHARYLRLCAYSMSNENSFNEKNLLQQLDDCIKTSRKIINYAEKNQSKIKRINSFFNIDMPRLKELIESYVELKAADKSKEHTESLASALEVVKSSFLEREEKMFQSDKMNLSVQIEVIKERLK